MCPCAHLRVRACACGGGGGGGGGQQGVELSGRGGPHSLKVHVDPRELTPPSSPTHTHTYMHTQSYVCMKAQAKILSLYVL